MSKELVISSDRHETKVAILEEDQLVEVYFQRSNEYSLAGSIHKGRVTRVLPGMQSAFVDLGLERDTFLYVSDFFDESEEYDQIPTGREERSAATERPPATDRPPATGRPPKTDRPHRTDRPERNDRERSQSSDRTDRDRGDRTDVVAQPPPVERLPEALETNPAQTSSAAEPPARDTLGGPRADADRDQRGRRSRRRRNRGRGFPDSKYASEVDSAREAPDSRSAASMDSGGPGAGSETLSEPVTSPTEDREFSVLPGETLAKYRRSPASTPSGDPVPHQPPRAAQSKAEPEAEPVIPGAAAVPAKDGRSDAAESVAGLQSENAPEAIALSEIVSEERYSSTFALEDLADSPQPAIEVVEASLTQKIVYARLEDLDGSLSDEADQGGPGDHPAETETEASELDSAESEPGAEPQTGQPNLTANVREQGGRYMHRMPRRMRRKMRTEGRPGAEPASGAESSLEAGVAPAPVVQPAPSPRPDAQRTVARPDKPPVPSISDLLKEGQEILVQIAKEPLGQKGARITSHIALPGRYVVYMPTLEHMGVSRKVGSDEERLRLKRILQTHSAGMTGGFIVRTAGEGKPEDEIAADMSFLFNLWVDIRQKAEKRPAPLLLHHDLDIVQRILRDQFTDDFKAIWVDNEELYESVLRFVQRFHPPLVTRVKLYTRSAPIFDAFNVTPELEKALRPKVWLKSGGYIVINQTEALVAIDVNTGKYVGKSNRLEDTIVKTNTEAVREIVRQIRLRDLGGIIVVDFIDMDERKNRQKVMQTLEEAMRSDKAPNKILQFNDFGLVAITRKRVKQSLERALCSPCPYCEGAGYVKSVQTTVTDILQEAHKIASTIEGKDVILRVHPDVAKFLKSNQNRYLEELEETLRRPVMVKADPALHHEKFDLG